MSLNLAPNVGATPAGSYYTAVYHLDDGTVSKEYWSIPNVPSTTVAAIRSLVMPASVAMQTVSTSQINSMLGSYLPLNGGTLRGALQLQADPVVPMQAATKNYVDNAVAPITAQVTNVISSAPKATQAVQQPTGSNLAVNIFQGKLLREPISDGKLEQRHIQPGEQQQLLYQFRRRVERLHGQRRSDLQEYTKIRRGSERRYYGDNVNNLPWPFDTHVHDERNGVTADYYENPFSVVPQQTAGQEITTAYTMDYQNWPTYQGNQASSEYLLTTDFAGGYNFDNYFGAGQPDYFFKTYYSNLSMSTTNYTSGQQEAIENIVKCHGTGTAWP